MNLFGKITKLLLALVALAMIIILIYLMIGPV